MKEPGSPTLGSLVAKSLLGNSQTELVCHSLFAGRSIDLFTQDVSVPRMPSGFLDHVDEDVSEVIAPPVELAGRRVIG